MFDILKPVRNAWGWLTLADYDAAKEQATYDINSRYGRGNVNFQNGSSMDATELDRLSAKGDKAEENLNKQRAAA